MDSLDINIRASTKCYWKIKGTIKIYLPTDIRKEGSAYDLTLAIGILAASEQIGGGSAVSDYYIAGELALDGSLQPIRGALPNASTAARTSKSATSARPSISGIWTGTAGGGGDDSEVTNQTICCAHKTFLKKNAFCAQHFFYLCTVKLYLKSHGYAL
ncbi:MAG: hypothetical protein K6A41_01285 [Bacteroidales bacterium]|nr:hypothetical protein [Bacteroidales bacterium]